MPRGYPSLTTKQKEEIIFRIKEKGEKVADLSKEFGVVPKTVYNLLKRQIDRPNIVLELAKVKREREDPCKSPQFLNLISFLFSKKLSFLIFSNFQLIKGHILVIFVVFFVFWVILWILKAIILLKAVFLAE